MLLEKIHAALAKDPRFQDLSWYTQREMDTVGWSLPVQGTDEHAEA